MKFIEQIFTSPEPAAEDKQVFLDGLGSITQEYLNKETIDGEVR